MASGMGGPVSWRGRDRNARCARPRPSGVHRPARAAKSRGFVQSGKSRSRQHEIPDVEHPLERAADRARSPALVDASVTGFRLLEMGCTRAPRRAVPARVTAARSAPIWSAAVLSSCDRDRRRRPRWCGTCARHGRSPARPAKTTGSRAQPHATPTLRHRSRAAFASRALASPHRTFGTFQRA